MADVDGVLRWVQALESGEFRQCRDAFTLRDADGESREPLGVLITLAMRDGVELRVEWDELLGCARYGDEPDWVLPPHQAASRTSCSAARLGTLIPTVQAISAIASSNGAQTIARSSRR